ncbi:MAG: hypothetical protein C4516_04745 [Oxalobacter sp.]|nr:MAG: hypothetical protein C4516_04745 [Oxalobacter sp.]
MRQRLIQHKEDAMKLWRSLAVIVLLLFSQLAMAGDCDYCVCKGNDTVNSCTACCKAAEKRGIKPEKLALRISSDGKTIVDQHGKEVARFSKNIKVHVATKGVKDQKLQGCWHCYPECVVWDGNRCMQWIRTCDWDFDCKK